jgi:drug/metabolite transporter (DMT)-like permease
MNTSTESSGQRHRLWLVAAFAAVYIVWGSTYLAIRVAVETLPPFLSAGVRFLIAGGVLFAVLVARGAVVPTPIQWKQAAITGTLMLVGGNGLVMWAEKTLSSGFTALLVALAPIWFALLEWLRPAGVRPQTKTIAGIIIGFAGVVVLVNGRGHAGHMTGELSAAVAVVVAGLCWAGGSLYSKYGTVASSPWMSSAAQMICGGAGLLFAGVATGEPTRTDWSSISARSLAALGYLIVFGSWIGFSAYVWLLKASTPARVSTYAYVNPVIAVFLGWALLGERLNSAVAYGAAIILCGVVVITLPPGSVKAVARRGWREARRWSRAA